MKGYLGDGRFHYLLADDVLAKEVVSTPRAANVVAANVVAASPVADSADAALFPAPESSFDTQLFDHDYCLSLDGAYRITEGRGISVVFPAAGRQLFLKSYRRGGMIRHLSEDRYFFTGLARTRGWREFRLLETMNTSGLAVPQPFACRVEVNGITYRASLIVDVIDNRGSLAEIIKADGCDSVDWHALGKFIGGFGRQRIFHADLNASNILVAQDEAEVPGGGGFYLIDFDRGRQFKGLRVPLFHLYEKRMLRRLQRSLLKTAMPETSMPGSSKTVSGTAAESEITSEGQASLASLWQPMWQAFLAGYGHTVKQS